jgi:hypothetical protein
MVWIKFHDSLCSGYWKGIPRGVRFVLMELSLLARAGDGQIDLPFGTADPIEGLIELLGGNRREARLAIRQLEELGSISFESESQDHATGSKPKRGTFSIDPVVYRSSTGRVSCVIPSWTRWQSVDRSASRMRKHRAKGEQYLALEQPCDASHNVTVTACDGDVTVPVTVPVTVSDGDVTLLDKRRGDKNISLPSFPAAPDRCPTDIGEGDTAQQQDQAALIFEHFLAQRAHVLGPANAPKLTKATKGHIAARLRVFSAQQLRTAIDVMFGLGSFWVENHFTTPAYAFRSDDQVEKLLARATKIIGRDDQTKGGMIRPQSDRPELRRLTPPPRNGSLARLAATETRLEPLPLPQGALTVKDASGGEYEAF